jgi:hypothetical protein
MPVLVGSTTLRAAAIATAASAALPPLRKMLSPASLASGCVLATIQPRESAGDRLEANCSGPEEGPQARWRQSIVIHAWVFRNQPVKCGQGFVVATLPSSEFLVHTGFRQSISQLLLSASILLSRHGCNPRTAGSPYRAIFKDAFRSGDISATSAAPLPV